MKLYRFIAGPDDSAFCHRVTKAVSNGWKLHGSPNMSFHAGEGVTICGQAITKDVPDEQYREGIKLGDY